MGQGAPGSLDPDRLKAAADAVFARGIAADDVPGLSAIVTTCDGTAYEGAFGVRDLGTGVPFTLDTICNVASLTKAVVTLAVMQLVERGRLDLDVPLSGVLPAAGALKVIAGRDAEGLVLRDPASPVTLRQALTHTAGFTYDFANEDYLAIMERTGVREGQRAWLNMPLLFDPGTRYTYGIGIDWAAQALEVVTGQTLEAYIQQHISGPLGMAASWRITPAMRARMASIHQRRPDGTVVPTDLASPQDYEIETGGGGIHTTVRDYGKFVRMILNRGLSDDGTRLVSEDTIALMSRADSAPNNAVTPIRAVLKWKSNDGEFFPNLPKRYGLGFMINESRAPTGRSAGSLAWAGSPNCYYWIDPAAGVAGVFMAQLFPFLDVQALRLFHAFEAVVYDTIA